VNLNGREIRIEHGFGHKKATISKAEEKEQRNIDPIRLHLENKIDQDLKRMNVSSVEKEERKKLLLLLEGIE
jgi:hypothetical protein